MGTGWRPYAAMMSAVMCWAAGFPVVSIALRSFSPLSLAAIRFGVAAIFALCWIAWKRPAQPSTSHLVRFGACGLLGLALYTILMNVGQTTVSAGSASFISNSIPILTALLAWLLLREPLGTRRWTGSLIGLVGVSSIAMSAPGGLAFGTGSTLIVVASLCKATYFVLQKPLIAIHGAITSTAYTIIFAAVLLSPWYPNAMRQISAASPGALIAASALAIFPTVLAYLASTYALDGLPAAAMASFINLIAPLATLLAFVLLGDVPSFAILPGAALAILGMVMVTKPAPKTSDCPLESPGT